MKLKRTAADDWFSKCIRIAANYTCEVCETGHQPNSKGLHCSHFIGRANYSVRFDPLNAWAHCKGCHDRLGSDPLAFTDWVQERLGETGIQILKNRARNLEIGRHTRRNQKEISAHYRAEFNRLEALRMDGNIKPLEVDAYPIEEWSAAFKLGVYS